MDSTRYSINSQSLGRFKSNETWYYLISMMNQFIVVKTNTINLNKILALTRENIMISTSHHLPTNDVCNP